MFSTQKMYLGRKSAFVQCYNARLISHNRSRLHRSFIGDSRKIKHNIFIIIWEFPFTRRDFKLEEIEIKLKEIDSMKRSLKGHGQFCINPAVSKNLNMKQIKYSARYELNLNICPKESRDL